MEKRTRLRTPKIMKNKRQVPTHAISGFLLLPNLWQMAMETGQPLPGTNEVVLSKKQEDRMNNRTIAHLSEYTAQKSAHSSTPLRVRSAADQKGKRGGGLRPK